MSRTLRSTKEYRRIAGESRTFKFMDRLRHQIQNASTLGTKTDFKPLGKKFKVDRKNPLLNDWIEGSRTKPVSWSCLGNVKKIGKTLSGGRMPAEKSPLPLHSEPKINLSLGASVTYETAESGMCFQRENTWPDRKLRTVNWKTCWQNLGWAGLLKLIRTSWGKQNPGSIELPRVALTDGCTLGWARKL